MCAVSGGNEWSVKAGSASWKRFSSGGKVCEHLCEFLRDVLRTWGRKESVGREKRREVF